MIKIRHVRKEKAEHSCDNCNREMPLVLVYKFSDSNGKLFAKLTLCEDCANAVANLFYSSMENGEDFKYEYDEITKIEKECEVIENVK